MTLVCIVVHIPKLNVLGGGNVTFCIFSPSPDSNDNKVAERDYYFSEPAL